MKDTTLTPATTTSRLRRNRLIGALAIAAAAVIALPLAMGGASAGLDDGRFCIAGEYLNGGQTAQVGGKMCETPVAPEVPVVPQAVITITGCAITNNPLGLFQSVRFNWTTSRELPGMRFIAEQGSSSARVPESLIKKEGTSESGVVSYSSMLTQQQLQQLNPNLLGSTTNLVVKEESDPRIHPSDPKWVAPAIAKANALTMTNMGMSATCVPVAPFALVGSTDGVSFGAPSETLTFAPNLSGIAAGQTRYAFFSAKTVPGSPGATVNFKPSANNGARLTYGVRQLVGSTTCNASTFGAQGGSSIMVPSNSPLTTGPSVSANRVYSGSGSGSVGYCFAITRPASDTAGAYTGSPSWVFGRPADLG